MDCKNLLTKNKYMIQLLFHLIGDYLLQNDWMAQNKKKKGRLGFLACTVHCSLYSIPFLTIGTFGQVSLIFITHFLIDRWYFVKFFMNIMGQKQFAQPPMAPWSIIAVDNTFHIACNFIALSPLIYSWM